MEYTIKIPNEFKSEYAGNKFEETFERLLADTKGKVDVSIYKKVNQMEHAFAESEINENGEIILSLPYEDKPEDILKAASSKLTTIYPYLCGRYERETIDMLSTAFKDVDINIMEKTMEINMTGLERIREETRKSEILQQQEEEIYNNTKAEYRKYQKSAYESIKAYFDTLKTILDNSDSDYLKYNKITFNIKIKELHMIYSYSKNSMQDLSYYNGNCGLTFRDSYETVERNHPEYFEDLGFFTRIAEKWNYIQASLEQEIITRISHQNDLKQDEINRYKKNIENYKKLSNEGNTRKAAEYER